LITIEAIQIERNTEGKLVDREGDQKSEIPNRAIKKMVGLMTIYYQNEKEENKVENLDRGAGCYYNNYAFDKYYYHKHKYLQLYSLKDGFIKHFVQK
jgi:hypothetical protein